MATAALKIRKKPVPFIIEMVRHIVSKMLFNPDYSSPNPSLGTITTQVNFLEVVFENAIHGGKNRTELVRAERKKMFFMMGVLTAYVQYASGGNETKIRGAGYDIKNPSTPVGLLPPPGKVRTEFGEHPGEIDVQWDAVPKRTCYSLQMSDEPLTESSWKEVPGSMRGKLRFTVGNLEPGKMYWFRVFTRSTAGISGPSDITGHRAA